VGCGVAWRGRCVGGCNLRGAHRGGHAGEAPPRDVEHGIRAHAVRVAAVLVVREVLVGGIGWLASSSGIDSESGCAVCKYSAVASIHNVACGVDEKICSVCVVRHHRH
jgi:hypothetical protein